VNLLRALTARIGAALAARFQMPDCCPHPDLTPEETTSHA
jgi:hypothetical protein